RILNILAAVSTSALPGTVIDLVPTDGPERDGIGAARMRNELTYRGGARFLSILPQTAPGRLQIVGDLAIFLRGDSNVDGAVDLSDAVYTLGYLFSEGAILRCEDAADANDDGRVDISDPIATLGNLFLGTDGIPPPTGAPGRDETPDII